MISSKDNDPKAASKAWSSLRGFLDRLILSEHFSN
nr:MAG TPA: hypothetical protein [Caudoviricetes sp.]